MTPPETPQTFAVTAQLRPRRNAIDKWLIGRSVFLGLASVAIIICVAFGLAGWKNLLVPVLVIPVLICEALTDKTVRAAWARRVAVAYWTLDKVDDPAINHTAVPGGQYALTLKKGPFTPLDLEKMRGKFGIPDDAALWLVDLTGGGMAQAWSGPRSGKRDEFGAFDDLS